MPVIFSPPCAGARGFTLIEVLIALVVLSVGLLGLAALQFRSLSFSSDAHARVSATYLAMDIIERIHANAANAADYKAGDPGISCSETDSSVDNDLACWYDKIGAALPNGTGTIADDPDSATGLMITVGWGGRVTGTAAGGTDIVDTFAQQWAIEP